MSAAPSTGRRGQRSCCVCARIAGFRIREPAMSCLGVLKRPRPRLTAFVLVAQNLRRQRPRHRLAAGERFAVERRDDRAGRVEGAFET